MALLLSNNMKFSTAVGCCPCSWPYLFTLSYISAKKKSKMEEREKPVSLLVNNSEQVLLSSSQAESTTTNQAPENAETLKSPNMSTDSGFEGENNRPLLLQTNLPSPAEDAIISSWRNDVFQSGELEFDVTELGSPKSPKKSTEDSDFNESPFDKKSVPSVGDVQSESDNDDSDHHCLFHNTTPIWCNGEISGWKENYVSDCQSTSVNGIHLIKELPDDDDDDDETCTFQSKDCYMPSNCCTSYKNCGTDCKKNVISSENEHWNGLILTTDLKDCALCSEGNNNVLINSDNDEQNEKVDTETDDGSDERNFDGTYSDDTLSAYYVPSAISATTEEYQLQPPVPPPRGIRPLRLKREGTQSEADADISPASRSYYKSLRSQSEPSQYTTVLKPKAVRPPPPINVDRVDCHSSLESLHSGRIVDVLGQRQERLSAFRERPRSSLSQSENVHVFFSRSLDTPPLVPSSRNSSDRNLAVITSILVSPSKRPDRSLESPLPILNWNDINTIVHPIDGSVNQEDIDQMSDKNTVSPSIETVPDSSSQVDENSNVTTTTSPSQLKRHSMPWDLFWNSEAARRPVSDYDPNREPIHMTLEEVRSSLQTLTRNDQEINELSKSVAQDDKPSNKRLLGSYLWQKKGKKSDKMINHGKRSENQRKSFPFSIKTAFTNLFGLKKTGLTENRFSPSHSKSHDELSFQTSKSKSSPNTSPFTHRALPPLPSDNSAWEPTLTVEEEWNDCGGNQTYDENGTDVCARRKLDYAASIEKVKDCGWYWGPISSEMAEKLLANEPDGSFVVRDSSDEHYIFSLTFKLNGLVRHVRIEHDHGNFSFGCQQKFRSNTIVDFIENAVAHSRSGRYLFFLHRRPILGPMQVQLLHPVSRFKQVQSLQHLCRFIILKSVRRDLISTLPLPRRMKDYLNTPHYYSEELANLSQQGKKNEIGTNGISSHRIDANNTFSQHVQENSTNSTFSNQSVSQV